ncbi:MAG: hypothetical protein R3Y23_03260 [Bacillota bacterium]
MLKDLLPTELYDNIIKIVSLASLTEVRLRLYGGVIVRDEVRRYPIDCVVDTQLINYVMNKATAYSMYAHVEEFSQGYISDKDGLRIGVTGSVVWEQGKIKTFRSVTSINIRIPKDIKGIARPIFKQMPTFSNTLIVSPPYAGKTTLIRDIMRELSKRYDIVCIDERREICGGNYDIGGYCDVISGVPKGLCYEGVIRAMSPEIIVMDELVPERDTSVIQSVVASGVLVLASIHGNNIKLLKNRYPKLLKYFNYAVLLSNKPRMGSIVSIERIDG